MAKKSKEPDKLALDAAAAKAANMSYGKWKAMQTPVILENMIPEGWLICENCGKVFKPKTRRPQKYCEVYCQRMAQRRIEKEREKV